MSLPRLAFALFLTSLLAACGGGAATEAPLPMMTATAAATVSTPPATTAGAPSAPAFASVATATMPAPDCAPEGCASLRIIDGNAEAWRIDAERRAALEARLVQL